MDPARRAIYADRVYRAVMDLQTGRPKEAYAHILKALMITPDQIRDQ